MFYICSMLGLHTVWFKNDLRVHDHAALRAAGQSAERDGGRVIALYIFDPDAWDAATPMRRQFLVESLRDLQVALDRRGAQLHIRYGAAVEIFSELHRSHRVLSIHTHETPETHVSDRPLEAWAMRAGVALRVHQQYGPLPTQSGFFDVDSDWEAFMSEPRREAADVSHAANVGVGYWPDMIDNDHKEASSVAGGRRVAIDTLRSILGSPSSAGASDPMVAMSGREAYQALKPYLDIGALSVRETWQAAMSTRQQYQKSGHELRAATLASFIQCLPALHLDKYRRQSARRGASKSGAWRSSPGQTQQMSFGFQDPKQA